MADRNAVFPANPHALFKLHRYSPAIRSGDLLFVSGMVGARADGSPEPDTKEQVRGGIIIPDPAKEKPQEAEVNAVGEGKFNDDGKRIPLDVKKGDTVLIGKYSGTEIKIDDVEYTILREDEVLAIVEG